MYSVVWLGTCGKEVAALKKRDIGLAIGFLLVMVHMMVIANDVQVILQDPNKANKPGEILKTAFDITCYFG